MKYLGLLALVFILITTVVISTKLVDENLSNDIRSKAQENGVRPEQIQMQSEHPLLLVNQKEIDDIKLKIRSKAWTQPSFNRIKSLANQQDRFNGYVPKEGYGSTHYYLCPNTGVALDYYSSRTKAPTSTQPGSHYCPDNDSGSSVSPQDIPGNTKAKGINISLDEIWSAIRHDELSSRMLALAEISQIDPDLTVQKRRTYALQAKTLLLRYADLYPSLNYHDEFKNWSYDSDPELKNLPWTGAGKIHGAPLFESIWAIKAAQTYDFIWNQVSFTVQERAKLDTFFRSLVTTLEKNQSSPNQQKDTNITAWENSAIGTVGFLLADKDHVLTALNGRSDQKRPGVLSQIANTLSADGFWPESIGYHAYVLNAFVNIAEAARHSNLDLYSFDVGGNKKLQAMFDYYKKVSLPNGSLPALDDSNIQERVPTDLMDLAYSRFNDDFYAWIINTNGGVRNKDLNLLYGQFILPGVSQFASPSFKGNSVGVLRNKSTYALLNYGSPNINHQHFAKPNLLYFADNTLFLPDLGFTSYGDSTYQGWYRTTLAHNAVVVDGKNQSANTLAQLLEFTENEGWYLRRMKVITKDAYSDLQIVRLIVLTPDYLVDSIKVKPITNPTNHTFDLPYHVNIVDIKTSQGLTMPVEMSSSNTNLVFQSGGSLGFSENGYQFLSDVQKAGPVGNNYFIKWGSPGVSKQLLITALTVASDDVIFSADGPFAPTGNKKKFSIWRKTGQSAYFASVIEPLIGGQRKVQQINLDGDKLTITRKTDSGSETTDTINLN